MKIIKHLFSRPGRRASANQSPPLRKKALLIGIQSIRQVIQGNHERTSKDVLEDVNAVPKQKNKKKKKDRETEGALKAAELKGPHRDVLEMRELLISALYHDILFLQPKGILTVV